MKSLLNIEEHPLEPFLPVNAKLLMLGSFPPQKKRWSITDRYQFATEADSNVQGHCNHRTKSNGYYS